MLLGDTVELTVGTLLIQFHFSSLIIRSIDVMTKWVKASIKKSITF